MNRHYNNNNNNKQNKTFSLGGQSDNNMERKRYIVTFEIGGEIVSDFTVEAKNLTDAKDIAQRHKSHFDKGRMTGKIRVNVRLCR